MVKKNKMYPLQLQKKNNNQFRQKKRQLKKAYVEKTASYTFFKNLYQKIV